MWPTARLLDSLMKSLRAGRSVQLWINLDTDTPDHKMPISRTSANALMRRWSRQLLSRLRRFRNFPVFSAVWTFNSNSRMLQQTHHPEILEFQRLLPYRITNHDPRGKEISDCAVIPSTTTASASARGGPKQIASRACRPAKCVSKAAIS